MLSTAAEGPSPHASRRHSNTPWESDWREQARGYSAAQRTLDASHAMQQLEPTQLG